MPLTSNSVPLLYQRLPVQVLVQNKTCIIDFRTELFGCKANACIDLIVFGCTGKTPLYYFSLDRSHIFCSVNCFVRRYQNSVCYFIARVKVMTSCTLCKIPQMSKLRDDYSMTEVMIFNACLTADYLSSCLRCLMTTEQRIGSHELLK